MKEHDLSFKSIDQALYTIDRLVRDGLDHGFFEYSISCETVSGNKRLLIVTAGKSHKFLIPDSDLRNQSQQ